MDIIATMAQKLSSFYSRLEEFIIKDETDRILKMKKKTAVHFCFLTMGHFILLTLLNPYIPIYYGLFALVILIGHYYLLKIKNSFIIQFNFVICALLLVYISSRQPENFLRIIAVVLCHHNQTYLVANSKVLRILLLVGTFFIVTKIQGQFYDLLQDNDLEKIMDAIKNLQYSWPLFYIFNYIFSSYLAKEYFKAFEVNQQVQKELKTKNEELKRVNERLKTTLSLLESKNKELKEAIKTRELFIATVSHELRNPLNSMLGNVGILSLEINNPKWAKMLETCKICGEVLLGLINNILDVAKINAEKLELNCQPTNFYRLIEKVWVVSTVKMKQKGLSGYLYIAKDVPKYVQIDSHRINQILLNLIGNANKFTKKGFVKVIITWYQDENDPSARGPGPEFMDWVNKKTIANFSSTTLRTGMGPKIDFNLSNREDKISSFTESDFSRSILHRQFTTKSLSYLNLKSFTIFNQDDTKIQNKLPSNNIMPNQRKGVLKIEVIDSGCGISESVSQRLFQAFSQADSSITRHFGGTGLGLYITKQLIHKMGGEINIYSKENIGSDFWMLIPCHTVTKEEVETSPTEEENNTTESVGYDGIRVLVVDDDPLNQMIMKNYFKRMNMQTETASDGQEALHKFKARENGYYSFITMDLQMPIMDGLTACKEIRRYEKESKHANNVPIAIVTANCIDLDRGKLLDPYGEIKASYIFRKPFTFDECQSCVGTMLMKGPHQSRRIKILIVDNDSFNTTVIKQFLEKCSFECDVCNDGREAVYKTSREEYDVVLIDCNMAYTDGYTTALHIRSKHSKVLIIGIVEGYKESYLKKAKEYGINEVEAKPLNYEKITQIIKDYVVNIYN